LKAGVAREMRRVAQRELLYDGINSLANRMLLDSCKALHHPTGTLFIFSRDGGMHSGGWWKNPDYERCWHLSMSFVEPLTGERGPKDVKLTEQWLEVFYGDDQRYIWAEPPYSPDGKQLGVWHYRVFCDPSWAPIIPRGEVYTKDFTERGWLSFSDLRNAHHQALAQLESLAGEQ